MISHTHTHTHICPVALRPPLCTPDAPPSHLPRALGHTHNRVALLVQHLTNILQQLLKLEGHLRDEAHVDNTCWYGVGRGEVVKSRGAQRASGQRELEGHLGGVARVNNTCLVWRLGYGVWVVQEERPRTNAASEPAAAHARW